MRKAIELHKWVTARIDEIAEDSAEDIIFAAIAALEPTTTQPSPPKDKS